MTDFEQKAIQLLESIARSMGKIESALDQADTQGFNIHMDVGYIKDDLRMMHETLQTVADNTATGL